jgi:pyruvate/2-oxoglutarate dehydrogenase complex dihydrolipoamide dehydrogenase (E3) component
MSAMNGPAASASKASDDVWRRLVAPDDYRNPPPKRFYHLVVIGAGPAGLVTAMAAAGLGARVALIERHRLGGDCLNVGCVPSKALLEVSCRPGIDFGAAFAWLREVRAAIAEHDSVERYTNAGVDVFLGAARFVDSGTVSVDGQRLRARRVVIATGARAALPPISGLAAAAPLTNETVFDLAEQPRRLAVIGGGPIGCELAQAFARLGVNVHLFEADRRLLTTESEAAAAVVQRGLVAAGVTLETSARIDGVERRGSQIAILSAGRAHLADRLLVATGRRPNTEDLNLAAVDVSTDDRGTIVVDDKLRTTNPRIFAAGDVCTEIRFTHHADAHARAVVQNALFAPTARVGSLVVPRCTYTSPELAQVGPTRDELDTSSRPYDLYTVRYADTDRGRTQGDHDGFIEVLTVPGKARILGATIVGRDAGEQIAPICIALANGLGIDAFGKSLLPYPTRAEALKRIADQYSRKRLTPRLRKLFARWFDWIG